MILPRLALFASLSVLAPLSAQCPVTNVTFTPYAAGCSQPFPNEVPKLGGVFVPSTCTVSMWISAYAGCCNVSLNGQAFLFGAAPTAVPLPGSCTLLVNPLVILPVDRSVRVVHLALPAAASAGTVYAQGVAPYVDTRNRQLSYALTQGLVATLQ